MSTKRSKYFNTEILENLKKRIASKAKLGRYDGHPAGGEYVIFVSTPAGKRIRSSKVKKHLEKLFLSDDEDLKPLKIPAPLPNCKEMTAENIRNLIMGVKSTTATMTKSEGLPITTPQDKEDLPNKYKMKLMAAPYRKSIKWKMEKRLRAKQNEVRKLNPPADLKLPETMPNGKSQLTSKKTSRKGSKSLQRHSSSLSECSFDFHQFEESLMNAEENIQIGDHRRAISNFGKQLLAIIRELYEVIRNSEPKPVTWANLFNAPLKFRFRKHILGYAASTWSDCTYLRDIYSAVRSCLALLRKIFQATDDLMWEFSLEEQLVDVIDKLYYAYLWLCDPKTLEARLSSIKALN